MTGHSTLEGLIDAYAEVREAFDPDEEGYAVLVEPGDNDEAVRSAIGGYTMRDALFEGPCTSGDAV